jgi:hypothetical protein
MTATLDVIMNKKKERLVWYQGAHLRNVHANRAGFAAIIGLLGIIIIETLVATPNRYVSFGLTALITSAAFLIATKIFK